MEHKTIVRRARSNGRYDAYQFECTSCTAEGRPTVSQSQARRQGDAHTRKNAK